MPLIGKVKNILLQGHDIKWKIEKFSNLEKDGVCYYSPEFSHNGESWFLGIDPNGDSYNDSFGYINLYLYRKSSGPLTNVNFSLSLKTVNGSKNHERHCTGVFQQWNHHQFLRFISTSELEERKPALLPSDILTIVCTIQSANSTASIGDIMTGECIYCKETLDCEVIPMHEKKCTDRPIKCPECSTVVLLWKWNEHECQMTCKRGDSSSSAMPQMNKILKDFKQLFQNQEDCDVVIKVKEKEFPAHRAILKVRSPVFASTFRNDMQEKLTGIINIEDCGPSAFSQFLCFLYCEDVVLSLENVFDLYSLSDKYDVPDLKNKSLQFIKANLSIDTFCETITLAMKHTEMEMIKLATDFFIKNAQEIIQTVKWQSFLAENPTQSNELFIKLLDSKKCFNA